MRPALRAWTALVLRMTLRSQSGLKITSKNWRDASGLGHLPSAILLAFFNQGSECKSVLFFDKRTFKVSMSSWRCPASFAPRDVIDLPSRQSMIFLYKKQTEIGE